MAEIKNTIENTDTISENIKGKLNPLLKEYFIQRKAKNETQEKDTFFAMFETLSPEEKRSYRDYVYKLIKGETIEKDQALHESIDALSSIDKLEIYAGICNRCKIDLNFDLPTPPASAFSNLHDKNIPTEYLGFQEPNFTVQGGKVTLRNGVSHEFGNLYTEYMGNGQYKLFLEDLGGTEEAYLVIGRNEKGGIVVYGKDGHKEFETQKFNKHIKFPVPTLGLSVEMKIDKI